MKYLRAFVYIPFITALVFWFVFDRHVDTFVPPHRMPCPVYRHPKVTRTAADWMPAGEDITVVLQRRDGWVKLVRGYDDLPGTWARKACLKQWL